MVWGWEGEQISGFPLPQGPPFISSRRAEGPGPEILQRPPPHPPPPPGVSIFFSQ